MNIGLEIIDHPTFHFPEDWDENTSHPCQIRGKITSESNYYDT